MKSFRTNYRVLLALAVALGGCSTVTTRPQAPLTITKEDGSRWFVLPVPESAIRSGDAVCLWGSASWLYGQVTRDRGEGVFALANSDRLLTPENYAGKLIKLPEDK